MTSQSSGIKDSLIATTFSEETIVNSYVVPPVPAIGGDLITLTSKVSGSLDAKPVIFSPIAKSAMIARVIVISFFIFFLSWFLF